MLNHYPYADTRIAIFAKAPVAGQTKTRMLPELTPAQSASLQNKLIRHICEVTSQSQLCPIELWCTPDKDHQTFTEVAEQFGIKRYQQNGKDLGERIIACLTNSTQTTLILGTDCPFLEPQHLNELIHAIKIQQKDISIIPADDGGYVALACQARHTTLFQHIDWGSDKVYQQTIAAAEQSQLKIHVMAAMSDVDYYSDYLQMCKNLPNLAI